MCNALGHRPGCSCGFGPRHGHAGPAYNHAEATQLIRLPGRIISERLWYATTCWWCTKSVFFFRNENGGCALFDEPGAPWQVHECWRLHSEAQRFRAQSHYQRQAAQPRLPVHQSAPRGQARVKLVGYVVRVQLEAVRLRGNPGAQAGAFASVHVCDKQNRLYHLLVPEPGARKLAAHDTVRAPAVWLRRAGTWHLFADTVRVDAGRNRLDLTIPGAPLALPVPCAYCGDAVNDECDWGIDPAFRVECPTCSRIRGRVADDEFALHCTERTALRSVRTKPLPGKLPGTYTGEKGTGARLHLGDDHCWRRDGDAHPAGDFSFHQEVVRLYENGEIVHAFRVKHALNGTTLREVLLERSRGRRGSAALALVRVADRAAPRASRASPKRSPKPRRGSTAGRSALQVLQPRLERARARYEAILAHERALNTLFALAGRRTAPAHWDRDAAELERIRAELDEECRKLQSSCRKLRLLGTAFGIFARPSFSPLVRGLNALEQNATRHPRPRGPVPARPGTTPRPQPVSSTTAPHPQPAATPPTSPAESTRSAPPTAAPPPASARASTDLGEKLRRALASPGEAIRTENL